MPAPKGNTYNKKFQTSEERKEICELLIEHLEQGFKKTSFPYCALGTLNRLMEEYPEDLVPELIYAAYQRGNLRLEKAGMEAMDGERKFFPDKVWKFMLQNRDEATHRWAELQEQMIDTNINLTIGKEDEDL